MLSREKDQADFDLETFVDLFDTAITSDNPAVQKALKNLLMVVTLVHAKQDGLQDPQGPLRRVIDDIQNLNRRLSRLEDQKIYPQAPVTTPYTPTMPTIWPNTNPNVVTPYTGNPNWPPGTITCSSDTIKSEDC
jgi:hypothetical protein